ncbi:tyrosine kinase receptor Cad96Ca [Nephila pilipes]|uniref:Tyrosine kinase receptor Cad96Ca n=1 Tax=Nephila pilipes TaxID=299642 RepID=A0A8X6JPL2_NEPPI|nr:tyrosine kinase receptor Cad96Ca [Nephila pilipes]
MAIPQTILCLAASLLITLGSSGSNFLSQNTPPLFEMKREWIIPEDEPVGRRVTTVRTRDDEGDPIEYGIEPAVFLDGSSYFSIDKKTGKVVVARPLTGLSVRKICQETKTKANFSGHQDEYLQEPHSTQKKCKAKYPR